MEYTIDMLNQMAKKVRKISKFAPSVGIVLGSGYANFVNHLEDASSIAFKDIKDMPLTTNPAHKGEFVIGRYKGVNVIVMNGRLHNYEGYTSYEVITPIRVMCLLGIKGLLLTNAAGALNPKYHAGDTMIINDQISSFVPSPLTGSNYDELGVRFPDMSNVYDSKIVTEVFNKATELGLDVKKGCYIQFRGPQYESKAEARFARLLGGDAVGMSTTTEAIAAVHMGVKVAGLSLITNSANGVVEKDEIEQQVELSDDEVLKVAVQSEEKIALLIELFTKALANA